MSGLRSVLLRSTKMSPKNTDADRSRRAYSIGEFCTRYGLGRSKAYDELRSGRLRGVKVGKRTLIREDDAEAWLLSLPTVGEEVTAFSARLATKEARP